MKTFEEKWTAWVDGKLTGNDLAQFESSLGDRSAADVEKTQAHKLGALLKEHLSAQILTNEEFFNHQIRDAIHRENQKPDRGGEKATWWSLGRLAWVGATAIVIFGMFTFFIVREEAPAPSDYLTQILHTQVDPTVNPYATTTVLEAKKDHVTVLWVEGLKSLPPEYAAK